MSVELLKNSLPLGMESVNVYNNEKVYYLIGYSSA